MRRLLKALSLMALLLPSVALADTPVRLVLDWVVVGMHAPFAAAQANGYFKQQGLDVKIDRGYGSGDTISKVGNGLYDIGYADPNLLLKWNHDNPQAKVVMVYLMWDSTQASIMTTTRSGIRKPKDLEGRTIGAPPGDNSRMMFPIFAKATGIDPSKIKWANAAPNIENPMLFKGEVDALSTTQGTTTLALLGFGMPANQIVAMPYAAQLPALMGVGVIVSEKTLHDKPEMLKAFVHAVVQGQEYSIAHPRESVADLKQLDPLIDINNELQRLNISYAVSMTSPTLQQDGLGAVTEERMKQALILAAEAFNVSARANTQDIYNTSFLPPSDQRPFHGYTPPPS
jgi:NitT/TauT family transport system substrate-binding protein